MTLAEMKGEGTPLNLTDSIYNRLLRERIIWLGSEVRDENANAICAQLLLLAEQRSALHQLLHMLLLALEQEPLTRRVRWSIDVDPMDMF